MPKKIEREIEGKRPKMSRRKPDAVKPPPVLSSSYEVLGLAPPRVERTVKSLRSEVVPDLSITSSKYKYVHIDSFGRTVINGMPFVKVPGSLYVSDYDELARKVLDGEWDEREALRMMCRNDLWFLTYFILGNRIANDARNHWVRMARMVQYGAKDMVLDLWAREHGKTTLLTENSTIQDLLVNPEETVCIFSYSKEAATVFFRNIKGAFESNEALKDLFREIVWETPPHKGAKWSESGIELKRRFSHKECSVEPHGLQDAMPTGRHFGVRRYDDIETLDLANSELDTQKMKDSFDMSVNVGKDGGRCLVTGTYYSHEGVLCYIRDKRMPDGSPMFKVRRVAATEDGTINGRSVYLSESRLTILKENRRFFNSQQLLDPSPKHDVKLPYTMINQVRVDQIPSDILRVMVIDPSGADERRRNGQRSDHWGMWVLGMERRLRDRGFFNVYILDGLIARMRYEEARDEAVRLYMRNGMIRLVGIEKTGQSTFDDHFSNALRVKGKHVTRDNERLKILTAGGVRKDRRIEGALAAPLHDGSIYMSDKVSAETKSKLREEMDKYGSSVHDDGLDALAYGYQMLQDFALGMEVAPSETKVRKPYRDPYEFREDKTMLSWMSR
jgi:hypothetical protein